MFENFLLKLDSDYSKQKIYSYIWLGNGENEKGMRRTKLILPYYIESWRGNTTKSFLQAKQNRDTLIMKYRESNVIPADVHVICLGLKISNVLGKYEGKNE